MRRTSAATALAAVLALVTALSGCRGAGPARVTARPATPAGTGSGASSPVTTPAAATAEVPTGTATAGPTSAQPCTVTVGSQLRERTTVTAAGAVSLLAGQLPCRSVGVWVSSFALDGAPAADPTPRFAGLYTGVRGLSARLPSIGPPCSAAAVYFSVDADDARDTSAAATAATAIRSDLAYWPAGQAPTVPAGAILAGRTSGVLAAAVTGDPSRCSPGESVATPTAAAGDCWLATAGGTGAAGGGFRATTCGAPHTHEVYWAEGLTPEQYLAQTRGGTETASTWARRHANDVCVARRGALRLAADVRPSDVFLELLWPSTLEYPPTGPAGWSRAQVVCLVCWQDGRASDRHLLHR